MLRPVVLGLGVALAIGLPAALVAQLLDELLDGDLTGAVTVPLAVLVLTGPVAGGWAVGRRRPPHALLLAACAGALSLALVSGLGVLRRHVADEEARASLVPAAAVLGALLGAAGSAPGTRAAVSVPSGDAGDAQGESGAPPARTQAEGLHQRMRGRGRRERGSWPS